MLTVQTRNLKGKDNLDVAAIKVDADDYKGKWGVIALYVDTYDWQSATGVTLANMGTLDIRVPQYCPANDSPVVDAATLNDSINPGSPVAVGKKYFFAVNNGVIGPAAFAQPDGTWDLMYAKFVQTPNSLVDGVHAIVNYSLIFTDMTPSTSANPTANGTTTLSVDNDSKLSDSALITEAGSTLTGHGGYIAHQVVDMTVSPIDVPPGQTSSPPGDAIPLFSAINMPTSPGYGQAAQLAMHPTSKTPGIKTYFQRLFLWAVNDGKIDGNGSNVATSSSYVSLVQYQLSKVQEWPCDDLVTVVINHYTSWTSVV
jgi:hypothetical protein